MQDIINAITYSNNSTMKCLSFFPFYREEEYTWLFKTTFLLTFINNRWTARFYHIYDRCEIDRQRKKILLKNSDELLRVLKLDQEENLSSVWRIIPNKPNE